jgi:hypothetical protein
LIYVPTKKKFDLHEFVLAIGFVLNLFAYATPTVHEMQTPNKHTIQPTPQQVMYGWIRACATMYSMLRER